MEIKVHGTIFSPWVRRLMATLEEKALAYELVNVTPIGDPDPDFLKISPLGKVPVLEVDGRYMPDSLAAIVYLDGRASSPRLFPEDAWQHGWMLWLCDFLGTGVFAKVEAPLFIQRFVNPSLRGTAPDADIVQAALDLIPYHFNYLEAQLQDGKPFMLGDQISLVDLTAASIFVNMFHAGEPVDRARWPKLAAYIDRLLDRPSFRTLLAGERRAVGERSPLFA